MKSVYSAIAIIIIISAGALLWGRRSYPEVSLPKIAMVLTSPAFQHRQSIPSKHTCDGENTSPPLAIGDVTESAKSLAMIVDDPDAPMGTWVHWTMWNIDPKTTAIAEKSVPDGAIQGITSSNKNAYGGPCPPSGVHRYFFKLYALDTTLNLSASSDKSALEYAMKGHTLATAELMGTYQRTKR